MAQDNRTIPGRQKKTSKINKHFLLIYILIGIMLLMLVLSIVQENFAEFLNPSMRNFKLISTTDAIKVIISLISLHLVKQGFELNFRPLLRYVLEIEQDNNPKQLKIFLTNSGKGTALITDVKYVIKTKGEFQGYLGFQNCFEKLKSKFELDDFLLLNISKGTSVSNNETIDIFKCPINQDLLAFEKIDLKIKFESFLGEEYEKEIYCIPLENKLLEIE